MKGENHVYRKDLIPLFARRAGLTQKKAEEVMDIFQGIVYELLCKNTAVHLTGFGIFRIREINRREARNPRTKEGCMIPAGYKPEFKASKGFREAVDRKIKENKADEQSKKEMFE